MSGELETKIASALRGVTGGEVEVHGVSPLFGGACQDNYRIDATFAGGELAGRRRLVLRSDAKGSLPGSLGRRDEFAVIEAAVRHGVKTPAVRWLLHGLVREGADAYFMDFAPGEAIGAKVLRDPALASARERLPAELAAVLARIHAITPASGLQIGGRAVPADPGLDAIAEQRSTLDRLPEPRPALELVLAWLADHVPAVREVTLVHGDFRTGNFLVTPEGLSGVLDWEFARWGDPMEDVAWLCVRDWRFGQLDRAAGGFAKRADFYRAYAEATGRAVDAARVHFWEIMGNVRWAIGAISQGLRYLTGGEADLELIAIARRASEMELEALRLIEKGP